MPKKSLCQKCKEIKPTTRHHALPRRWFGETDNIILLCVMCHRAIEQVIARAEQGRPLSKSQYWELTTTFLNSKPQKQRKPHIKSFLFRRR
jgi:hypothetical protein